MPPQHVIALIGNIAAGKSTVSKMLTERGALVIDADRVVHEMQAAGTPVTRAIAGRFGSAVLAADGTVDRPALGKIVFQDPDAMKELEDLVLPAVRRAIVDRIMGASAEVVVVESFRLLETPVAEKIDGVWFVDAPSEVRQGRLMADRGLSAEDALRRIQSQPELGDKTRPADVLLINDGSVERLEAQLDAAWGQLQAKLPSRSESHSGAP